MSAPDIESLYAAHVAERTSAAARALEETGYDRLLIHSGTPFTYFSDDNDAPFHPTPHFAAWAPLEGPGHLLEVVPGKRPRILRVTPRDFWYEPPSPPPAFVARASAGRAVDTPEAAWAAVPAGSRTRTAFLGDAVAQAAEQGLPASAINPPRLVTRFDWDRSLKTDYEVETIAEATVHGAAAFRAAESAFRAGGSEMEIHHAYLAAAGSKEETLPYTTIIALDAHAATLHYHGKETKRGGNVLLVDAGASVRGYGCDITRTWVRDGADAVFAQILAGMEAMQRTLAKEARPPKPYLEMHIAAHRGVARILVEAGVLKGEPEELYGRGLTRPFLPHGLGHFLGVQVHDVAGRYADRDGTLAPPPAEHPFLRTTRTIEPRQLFTIEPGIYFIPMLLEPFRSGPDSGAFDWKLVDRLIPCGGIRVEDNVFVGEDANRNLTREKLP
jgi:Xaa-Pro dipeptidase